jgi:mannose-6-phosphate isomerase
VSVYKMVNPVMAYAWGSREGIAAMQGRPASAQPEAELWMGAHPQAPSMLELAGGQSAGTLDALIDESPEAVLGPDVIARFGKRLPFLLKVLSAAEPLSLQVHPDDDDARAGFDAEEAAGIDRSAPERLYRDPYAKPEMLLATSNFELLLGFRAANEAAAALADLGVGLLDRVVNALQAGTATGIVFVDIVSWPDDERRQLVAEVCEAAASSDESFAHWLTFLADRYPNDPGVAGAMLLNHVHLQPGEAVYVAPGQIHAYLEGTGVELLGGSDNVLRGGLTPKQIALAELQRVLRVDAERPQLVPVVTDADGVLRWVTPRPEFALSRLEVGNDMLRVAGGCPQILLCIEGKVEIAGIVTVGGGESAFVTADTEAIEIVGHGVVLRAAPASFGETPAKRAS